jgi:N utilization substance protein B
VLTATSTGIAKPHPDHLAYTITLVEGVELHQNRIDELIASYAEGWTLERMPVIDRNLARIAVYELLYAPEIDDPVAITEAVELARQMSTDDSPRFLNGLLGQIADLRDSVLTAHRSAHLSSPILELWLERIGRKARMGTTTPRSARSSRSSRASRAWRHRGRRGHGTQKGPAVGGPLRGARVSLRRTPGDRRPAHPARSGAR